MKKRTLVAASAILLLSGCSGLSPLIDKMPFSSNQGNHSSEESSPSKDEAKENEEKTDIIEEQPNVPTLQSHYFNEIKEVNGLNVIQNPLNVLALVNKEFALPNDYIPEDLERPNVPFSFGDLDIEKSYLRKEAAEHLEILFEQAKNEGIDLFAVSGYRSYERQEGLFAAKENQVGREEAAQVVAIPGFSEHQSGLAMDISSPSVGYQLIEEYGETIEGQWLAENAHKFGFILRYPKGKESITGYQYEPWHYRYVGIEAATVIHEKNLTLEEYFNLVEKI
ncbi:M15 family metallopeptidase [Bacillus dakarensis]|uniref:M15 family metallopeptidase n=1 Tax=Robertmurraya dakarensis TaxID=1926278 RepID=UPI000980FABB|nr:M15 family metallopeptidase [Bacillus dakarensis]